MFISAILHELLRILKSHCDIQHILNLANLIYYIRSRSLLFDRIKNGIYNTVLIKSFLFNALHYILWTVV